MSQLFSTERLPVSDRIDAWQWNAQQICGDCRIHLPKTKFHGSIEMRHVGVLPLTRFSSSPLSFSKWPFETGTGENRSCIVITQLNGIRQYVQNGAEVVLRPGDSTVIDSARPWSSCCTADCVRLYLRVPRWAMENRLRTRNIPIAKRISGRTIPGATLSRLLLSLYKNADWMKDEELSLALDTYFETLAACITGEKALLHSAADLSRRILQFIDTHLSEPMLGPAEVAAAMGISVRHLHRVFSASGTTLGDYVRLQRLEQCRLDLANPVLQSRTITDIAFCHGFSDAAHFSHLFRQYFGISARAFRARVLIEEQAAKVAHVEVSSPHAARPRDVLPN